LLMNLFVNFEFYLIIANSLLLIIILSLAIILPHFAFLAIF